MTLVGGNVPLSSRSRQTHQSLPLSTCHHEAQFSFFNNSS